LKRPAKKHWNYSNSEDICYQNMRLKGWLREASILQTSNWYCFTVHYTNKKPMLSEIYGIPCVDGIVKVKAFVSLSYSNKL